MNILDRVLEVLNCENYLRIQNNQIKGCELFLKHDCNYHNLNVLKFDGYMNFFGNENKFDLIVDLNRNNFDINYDIIKSNPIRVYPVGYINPHRLIDPEAEMPDPKLLINLGWNYVTISFDYVKDDNFYFVATLERNYINNGLRQSVKIDKINSEILAKKLAILRKAYYLS